MLVGTRDVSPSLGGRALRLCDRSSRRRTGKRRAKACRAWTICRGPPSGVRSPLPRRARPRSKRVWLPNDPPAPPARPTLPPSNFASFREKFANLIPSNEIATGL